MASAPIHKDYTMGIISDAFGSAVEKPEIVAIGLVALSVYGLIFMIKEAQRPAIERKRKEKRYQRYTENQEFRQRRRQELAEQRAQRNNDRARSRAQMRHDYDAYVSSSKTDPQDYKTWSRLNKQTYN